MSKTVRTHRVHALVVIGVLLLAGCSTIVNDSTANTGGAVLPKPPAANELPTDLSASIVYVAPSVNCADKNDPNVTCSTKELQATDADFTLGKNTAIIMTGDAISIFVSGKLLVPRPNLASNHDLWEVVNNSGEGIKLHMTAPFGSFRGYFTSAEGSWSQEQIVYLRNLHMERFMQPPQPRPYTPTPVANCGDRNGCPHVNWRVAVWDGSNWTTDSGFYQIRIN